VVIWARDHGLEVIQPAGARTPDFRRAIEAFAPDLGVVVAYGEILTRQLLGVPRLGFVNVHASLLPRYRGAAPIQAAIAAGDRVTGVTTMQLEPGLDSGPLLLAREVAIGRHDTAADLSPRLAAAGAELLIETLGRLEQGDLEPRPQKDAEATYAPRLTREDGRIEWRLTAGEIENRLRAYTPWPGLVADLGGESVKLLALEPREHAGDEVPGTVLAIDGTAAIVRCGGGTALAVERVQRPGRRPVTGAELVR
jgi:methionyl-tRNA formyltransferase